MLWCGVYYQINTGTGTNFFVFFFSDFFQREIFPPYFYDHNTPPRFLTKGCNFIASQNRKNFTKQIECYEQKIGGPILANLPFK